MIDTDFLIRLAIALALSNALAIVAVVIWPDAMRRLGRFADCRESQFASLAEREAVAAPASARIASMVQS